MDLDELQSIQNRERQTDSLQSLRASFYEEVGEYIQRLREERERVAEEEGFDAPAFRRLSDEIDTAEDTVESVYERRVGKIVKAASFAAAGMPANDEGLTEEEQALFDQLVADIEGNREHVLDVLAGEADAGAPTATGSEPDEDAPPAPAQDPHPDPASPDDGTGVDAADVMGGGGAPDRQEAGDAAREAGRPAGSADGAARGRSGETDRGDDAGAPTATGSGPDEDAPDAAGGDEHPADAGPPAPGERDRESPGEPSGDPDVDRATVLITRDVGEILGVDERAYDLGRDDVVDLPEANATPLLERDAAERLE